MDVAAVEATRSYRAWMSLENGSEFVYNQEYIKGKEGHDWLLRKNVWRRMRYRRENKRMAENMKTALVHAAVSGIQRQKMEVEQQPRSPVTLQLRTQQHHLINNMNASQQASTDAIKKYQAKTILPMVTGIPAGTSPAPIGTNFKLQRYKFVRRNSCGSNIIISSCCGCSGGGIKSYEFNIWGL